MHEGSDLVGIAAHVAHSLKRGDLVRP
jgi:hypothetical protein